MTPLMLACHYGFYKIAKTLLERGAEYNAQCQLNGWTALMYAANGPPSSPSSSSQPPHHHHQNNEAGGGSGGGDETESPSSKLKLVGLLISAEYRADTGLRNWSGKTAADIALQTGQGDIYERLTGMALPVTAAAVVVAVVGGGVGGASTNTDGDAVTAAGKDGPTSGVGGAQYRHHHHGNHHQYYNRVGKTTTASGGGGGVDHSGVADMSEGLLEAGVIGSDGNNNGGLSPLPYDNNMDVKGGGGGWFHRIANKTKSKHHGLGISNNTGASSSANAANNNIGGNSSSINIITSSSPITSSPSHLALPDTPTNPTSTTPNNNNTSALTANNLLPSFSKKGGHVSHMNSEAKLIVDLLNTGGEHERSPASGYFDGDLGGNNRAGKGVRKTGGGGGGGGVTPTSQQYFTSQSSKQQQQLSTQSQQHSLQPHHLQISSVSPASISPSGPLISSKYPSQPTYSLHHQHPISFHDSTQNNTFFAADAGINSPLKSLVIDSNNAAGKKGGTNYATVTTGGGINKNISDRDARQSGLMSPSSSINLSSPLSSTALTAAADMGGPKLMSPSSSHFPSAFMHKSPSSAGMRALASGGGSSIQQQHNHSSANIIVSDLTTNSSLQYNNHHHLPPSSPISNRSSWLNSSAGANIRSHEEAMNRVLDSSSNSSITFSGGPGGGGGGHFENNITTGVSSSSSSSSMSSSAATFRNPNHMGNFIQRRSSDAWGADRVTVSSGGGSQPSGYRPHHTSSQHHQYNTYTHSTSSSSSYSNPHSREASMETSGGGGQYYRDQISKLENMLDKIDLKNYLPVFDSAILDFDALLELTEEDLEVKKMREKRFALVCEN